MRTPFYKGFRSAVIILGGLLFVAAPAFGQEATAAADKAAEGLPLSLVLGLLMAGLLVLLLIGALVVTFIQSLPFLYQFYDHPDRQNTTMAHWLNIFRGRGNVFLGVTTNATMEHHSYDGIEEFDNDLPPWWTYLFYATIVFSVGYLLNFHVFSSGKLQIQEYEAEMQEAALFHPANSESNANEKTNFTVLTDATKLASGKTLFGQNCAACHGQNAEGMVGPNLTDEYWLHGGDVNEVFKTIKFGVTSKGMVAWQGKLSDDQILEVSSYILSLQGSNPANAKAPQGEKAK